MPCLEVGCEKDGFRKISKGLFIEIDDGGEVLGAEGGAADEAAVDLGLCHEALAVFGVHGAAVLNAHPADVLARIDLLHAFSDVADGLVGLCVGGRLSRADGPDGLVGDDDLGEILHAHEVGRDLFIEHLLGHAEFPFVEALPDADDGGEAGGEGCERALIHGFVGLSEVLAAFAVADDDVLHAVFLEHLRGDLARVGAALGIVHVLRAELDLGAVDGLLDGGDVDGGDAYDDVALGLFDEGL